MSEKNIPATEESNAEEKMLTEMYALAEKISENSKQSNAVLEDIKENIEKMVRILQDLIALHPESKTFIEEWAKRLNLPLPKN